MDTNNTNKSDSAASTLPIACDLNAIPAQDRAAHVVTAQQLFGMAQRVTELENGIELTLPSDSETFLKAAQFIAHERECCPFFTFTLEVRPNGRPLWLRLTGGEGVKEFLLSEFQSVIPAAFHHSKDTAAQL